MAEFNMKIFFGRCACAGRRPQPPVTRQWRLKMNWIVDTLGTSLGKKLLMAVSGLCFIAFLAAHLAGNLTIYGGADTFNSYAAHLHSLGPLLTAAEIGLLACALLHVVTGLWLSWQNWQARPVRYALKRSAGGRTLGSRTMPYSGVLILFFVIFHLMNFHFVDKSQTTIHQIVTAAFADPLYVLLYVAAMAVAALHVSHGLWSACQTLGASHPKYTPLIMAASLGFALIVGLGFGFLPIYISLMA
jgi:succinate dehydrogenase / fumarate reductase cytochrome b subunit